MSCKNRHAFCRLNTINRALKFPDEIVCAMAAVRIRRVRARHFVEAVQDESTGGEGASQISRPRKKEDRNRRGSRAKAVAKNWSK